MSIQDLAKSGEQYIQAFIQKKKGKEKLREAVDEDRRTLDIILTNLGSIKAGEENLTYNFHQHKFTPGSIDRDKLDLCNRAEKDQLVIRLDNLCSKLFPAEREKAEAVKAYIFCKGAGELVSKNKWNTYDDFILSANPAHALDKGVIGLLDELKKDPDIKAEIKDAAPPALIPSSGVKITPLKELLQKLLANNIPEIEAALELAKLLPDLKETEDLSKEETFHLCATLEHVDSKCFENLSPNIIKLIVGSGLTTPFQKFLIPLFNKLITRPVNKKKLAAFVRSFPPYNGQFRSKGNYRERMQELATNHENHPWNIYFHYTREHFSKPFMDQYLTSEVIDKLERQLSDEDLTYFLQSFFGFIASTTYSDNTKPNDAEFTNILKLVDDFSPSNQQTILKAFCHATPALTLFEVLRESQTTIDMKKEPKLTFTMIDNMIAETILKLNPEEEPEDSFFDEYLDLIFKKGNYLFDLIPKITHSVFSEKSVKRQQKLAAKIPHNDLGLFIQIIPPTYPLKHSLSKAKTIIDHGYSAPELEELIKPCIEELENFEVKEINQYFVWEYRDVYTKLLSRFKPEMQVAIIKDVYWQMQNDPLFGRFDEFVKKAVSLPLAVWRQLEGVISIHRFRAEILEYHPATFHYFQKIRELFDDMAMARAN